MRPVVEALLSVSPEEMALIKTLNAAELAEVVRRCKAKANAYLRSARLIEAWSKEEANGTRAN
jgi:hypothetical protein